MSDGVELDAGSPSRPEHRPPAVIVVAYGRPDLLCHCLAAVAPSLDVLVVDNSLDDEVEAAASVAGARYLRPARNLGFACAVNLGLTTVPPGSDVLLLNPDAVVDASSVLALQTALHRAGTRCAAVAPSLLRPDGSREPSRWPMPSPGRVWAGALGFARAVGPEFLPGAVLLLRAEALEDVGRFDHRFFLYSEEADWQLRAQRAGWHVHVVAEVSAVHVGGATSESSELRDRLFHGSAELFARKWFGSPGWWFMRAGSIVAALRRLVTARTAGRRREQLRIIRLYLRGPARCLPDFARSERPAA